MNYPKEEIQQEIGREAGKVYEYRSPANWVSTPLAGDTDFGIDYRVQLKTKGKEVKFSFVLQLKGTTLNKYSACGNFITHTFSTKTLNLYKNEESLVAIVIVDFSKNGLQDLDNSKAYYYFLEDEWFAKHRDKLHSNKSITIKIPVKQVFNRKLDITDYYQQRINKTETFKKLGNTICEHASSGFDAIDLIDKAIDKTPQIIDTLLSQTDTPWIDNPNGSIATKLKKIDEYLNIGNIDGANTSLSRLPLDVIEKMSAHESAEYHLLTGRLFSRFGQHQKAFKEFNKAVSHSNTKRYLTFLIQGGFRVQPINAEQLLELSEELPNEDSSHCFLKAKCLIIKGEVQKGLQLFDSYHPENTLDKMLLALIANDQSRLDELIDNFEFTDCDEERKLFNYHLICTRRITEKLIGRDLTDKNLIPTTGESSYDWSLISQAKALCDQAWHSAQKLGYPSDTVCLLDVSLLIYGFCNQEDAFIDHLKTILSQTNNNIEYIEPLAIMLFNSGKHHENYVLLKDIKDIHPKEAVLLALSCYYLNKYDLMLNIVRKHEQAVIKENIDLAPMMFCLAEGAANKMFEVEDEERFSTILDSFDSGKHLKQISQFIELANTTQEDLQKHAEDLYQYYLDNGKPVIVALQLLPNLSTQTLESANKVVYLGQQILLHRELTDSEYIHFCNALITMEDWKLIKDIATKQLAIRAQNKQWHFLKAIAHQNQGEIGESYTALKNLFDSTDNVTIDNVLFYVDICLKLGFLKDAEIILKKQVANTNSPEKKKRLLHALIHLYTYDGPNKSKQYIKVVKEFGKLVDQKCEQEESRFLTANMFTPSNLLDKAYLKLLQKRFDNFFINFPESKYLKKGSISEDSTGEDLISQINNLSQLDKDVKEQFDNNKIAIRNGSLPIPLSFLHQMIGDTNDIYQSWELSKTVDNSLLEFKIFHAPQYTEMDFSRLCQTKKVVFEETTLLTLYELNVLSLFLEQLDSFYLLETVFNNLTSSAHNIGGSICSDTAKGVLKQIKHHVHKLKYIPCDKDILNGYCELAKESDFLLLTDDAHLLFLTRDQNHKLLNGNTIDCLTYLVETKIIDQDIFADHIMRIAQLGFLSINMKFNVLSQIVHHQLHTQPNSSIKDLSCHDLLEQIFSLENNPSAIKALINYINFEFGRVANSFLLSVIKLLTPCLPKKHFFKFAGMMFIGLSVSSKVHREEGFLGASKKHISFWQFYKELCDALDIKKSEGELLDNLIQIVATFPKETSQQCIISISGAFFTDSEEIQILENIYASL